MSCICETLGQNIKNAGVIEALHGERYIVGLTCLDCDAQWISIGCDNRCPECMSYDSAGQVQHTICPEHGCRGPQSIWVDQKMRAKVIPVENRNVEYYANKLKNREHFSNARFGDGDWLTIFGYDQLHNSNGCTFTAELGAAVRQALKNNHPYDHALLSHPHYRFGLHIKEFLDEEKIGIHWVRDWVLNAMLKGELFPLFQQMREYRVLYVGPHDIGSKGFFPVAYHFIPPLKNAYESRDKILRRVREYIFRHSVDLVAWSCGGAAKVFIDEIYRITKGEITQIDFGSSFDGYFPPLPHVNQAGSRSFIRKGNYNWEELLRLNTGK